MDSVVLMCEFLSGMGEGCRVVARCVQGAYISGELPLQAIRGIGRRTGRLASRSAEGISVKVYRFWRMALLNTV
jgi:hypothetical protein